MVPGTLSRFSTTGFRLSQLPCLWFSCSGIFLHGLQTQRLYRLYWKSIQERRNSMPFEVCCSNFNSHSSCRTSTPTMYISTAAVQKPPESGLSWMIRRQRVDWTRKRRNSMRTATLSTWFLLILFGAEAEIAPLDRWGGKICRVSKATNCCSRVFSWHYVGYFVLCGPRISEWIRFTT